MAVILLGYVILGFFMDQVAILILTVPVVLPLVVSLGFDPVWFGVVVVVTAEVGMVTPPLGMNVFVVARYTKMPLNELFVGVIPQDRKSTRLNSSHVAISYVVFCFKKKTTYM